METNNKSESQPDSLDALLDTQMTVDDISDEMPAAFEFVSEAEWPDEIKTKLEQKWRRKRPVEGSWILLGNDELWLIPQIDVLGKDIEIKRSQNLFGKIKYTFSAKYRHYKQLRELFADFLMSQDGDEFLMEWEPVYMLMYLALCVNYKVDMAKCNEMGLLRQDHAKDICTALGGGVKKKVPPGGDLPLNITA